MMTHEAQPLHIAFVMDGNRRWAEERRLPIVMGHLEGALRIEPITEHAVRNGAEILTFHAFAKKNLRRPPEELEGLNEVNRRMLHDPVVERMLENNLRINWLGEIEIFPGDIVERIQEIREMSAGNSGAIVNFALNYNGRDEIVRAVNLAVQEIHEDRPITEDDISLHLYTAGQPDPAMIIRTGGRQRDSGFLIWQADYAQKYYTDTLWPDFHPEEYDVAMEWLSQQVINEGR